MHLIFQVQLTSTVTFHPTVFGESMFTYNCACQAKVAICAESKSHSQNCSSYLNLEMSTRVPRIESNYVFIYKLQAWYFAICGFWKGWKLCKAYFVKCPQNQKNIFDGQNGIWKALKTSTLITMILNPTGYMLTSSVSLLSFLWGIFYGFL